MKKYFLLSFFIFFVICNSVSANYIWSSYSDQTGVNINSVAFAGNIGYMAGDSGLIKKTTDAGKTWGNHNSGVNLNIRKIAVNSTGSIIATLAGNQTILVSVDNGVTWINRSPAGVIPSNIELKNITIVGSIIFAVGTSNIIIKSSDYGQTWIKQYEGAYTSNFVHFFNSNNGIVLGDRHILTTANGGVDWVLVNTPLNFKNGFCYNEYLWFGITENNRLYQTIEGASRWAFLYEFDYNINSLHLTSYNNGWAVGDNGKIYYTNPNPANWSKFEIPNTNRTFKLNAVNIFNNADTIFIAGNNGYYYLRTFDYSLSEAQLSRFIVADAGGPYFVLTGETVALTAEKTIARNKNFMRYQWTKNNEYANLFNSNTMNSIFRADKAGVYYVNLSVDDYRGNYSETITKICVVDTFVNLTQNDTIIDFSNKSNIALLFNNNLQHNINLKLKDEFQDLTVSIDRVNYAETAYILFVNRVSNYLLPELHSNISMFDEFNYTIVDFDIFDLSTKNNLNNQTFAFDTLKLRYALDAGKDNFVNRKMAIFRLDDSFVKWEKLSLESAYSLENGLAVEKNIEHFSIYGLFAIPYFANEDIWVYPNPFIPDDGNIKTGRYYTGADDGSGIYFSGKLMKNARIKIVNLAGFVMFETRNDFKEYFQWNVCDNRGRRMPSGLYYIIIEADNYKCVKKLQIVN